MVCNVMDLNNVITEIKQIVFWSLFPALYSRKNSKYSNLRSIRSSSDHSFQSYKDTQEYP